MIHGSGLGPATLVRALSFPIPANLAGTSVQLVLNGTIVNAPVVYTSDRQVAAIMPSDAPMAIGQVTVTYNGATSTAIGFFVFTSNVGVYTVNQSGSGMGVVTDASYQIFSERGATNPGQTVIIWGTGLGPVPDDTVAPTPENRTDVPLEVYIGGKLATLAYRGRSSCCAGLDQIVVTVPAGVQGCATPVVLKIGDFVSNTTTLPVAASGLACQPNISGVDLQSLLALPRISLGRVTLNRTISLTDNMRRDTGAASFLGVGAGGGSVDALFDHGQFGTCLVGYNTPAGVARALDAGPMISVEGPAGTRSLLPNTNSTTLGDGTPG